MSTEKRFDLPIRNIQDATAKFSQLVYQAEEQDQLITNCDNPKSESLLDFFKRAPLPDVDLNLERE